MHQNKPGVVTKSSAKVSFKQTGLLKDFKVNLVRCLVDSAINNEIDNLSISENESSSNKSTINLQGDFQRMHKNRKVVVKPNVSKSKQELNMRPSDESEPSENKCPDCNLNITSRGKLMSHIHMCDKHIADETDDMYQCPDCELTYSSRYNLKRHRLFTHLALIQKIKCDKCEKTFTTVRSLKEHKERVHPTSPFKGFKCGECRKTYSNKRDLKSHRERVHEGITYGCVVCNHITGLKRNMQKHCRKTGHDLSMINRIREFP